ncbi:MAG: dual specificity protein phosphatase [Anaerolineae bacterium]|nr:dual specificity protein phosphatase [Anaerolineae bacterium]
MTQVKTSPNPLTRMVSLIKTGPRALVLRFYDQIRRRVTGAPDFTLTRVRPFLHVGGQHYKRGWHHMEKEGITGILNMREEWHDDVKMGVGGKKHLHLVTRDNTPVSIDYLHQAADFIKEHKDSGEQVYVHCGVGVGRAPSAAAAYFIKYENMTPAESLAHMRQTRPFIHPTGKQRRALEQFETEVRNE